MLQELTVRGTVDRMGTLLAWYLDAFPEVELSKNPVHLPPVHVELPVEEDPIPSPPLSLVPGVPIDDEGYHAKLEDVCARDEGYDVWGVDDPKDSSTESVRSVINIVELPEIIMLTFDETEGDEMVVNQGKGSIKEDTWSSGTETSNSSDPDLNHGGDKEGTSRLYLEA